MYIVKNNVIFESKESGEQKFACKSRKVNAKATEEIFLLSNLIGNNKIAFTHHLLRLIAAEIVLLL